MDNQRDSGWIEPLEATTLSADEETKTQTPILPESDINQTGPRIDFSIRYSPAGRGRTIKGGGNRGCRKTPPSSNLQFSMPRSGWEMEPFPSAKTATEPTC